MIESKLSISRIEKMLRTAIKTVYSGYVTYSDRPVKSNDNLSDFIVVRLNGSVNGTIATDEVISGKAIIMFELWAKDKGSEKVKDVNRLIEMRDSLMSIIPYYDSDYRITYKNEVGNRDRIGFHAEFINFNLQII